MWGGMHQPANAAARLQALETALNLQPAQKPAFDAFAARIKSEAEARTGFRENMQKLAGDPQAMADYRVSLAKYRAEAMDAVNQLRKALVAVLTPEQRAVLDQFGPGPGGAGRHMMGGPGGAARSA
jgi:hypothetical protein